MDKNDTGVVEVKTKQDKSNTKKMSAYIGSIADFVPNHTEWDVFEEKLKNFFISNDIDDEAKKTAILLTKLDEETFKLLRDLLYPDKVSGQKFNDLCKKLTDYYGKPVSIFRERSNFYLLFQNQTESVNQWLARIKHTASNCKFGTILPYVLRDKFVTGMKQGTVADSLKEKDEKLTLDEALKLAIQKETIADVPSSSSVFSMQHEKARNYEHKACKVCGGFNHNEDFCRFKKYRCRLCDMKGHLAKVCVNKRAAKAESLHFVDEQKKPEGSCEEVQIGENLGFIYNIMSSEGRKPIKTEVMINKKVITMEIDTGSPITVIAERVYDIIRKNDEVSLSDSSMVLRGYTGEQIIPIGRFDVNMIWGRKERPMCIYVVKDGGPSLLGRDFMDSFGVGLTEVNQMDNIYSDAALQRIIGENKALFENVIGKYNNTEIKLQIKQEAVPIFCKHRAPPLQLKEKIESELKYLEEQGVITKVKHNDWATPLVPVLKHDGSLRLCGDYRITINKFLIPDRYPIPRIDDVFRRLQGGRFFSKIDLRSAYNQIVLDEESKKICAWSTHKGTYLVNRLPYGIVPATGIFQRIIEDLFCDLDGVAAFVDDIVVTGESEEEHLKNLDLVFRRLREAGLTVKQSKCEFYKPFIKFLGHKITENGLEKTDDKIQAILELRTPTDVKEVRALMGLVNYYARYIPDMATVMCPIYELTRKEKRFSWTQECDEALNKIKQLIVSDISLVHYDPNLPIILQCDASDVGISAVLLHRFPNNQEKPIAFASRTLLIPEKGYSTGDKEGLAVYWGVKKFYEYLYGRDFIIRTDHMPLLGTYGENKPIPVIAARRVQRWATFLAAFQYKIEHVQGKKNNLADAFSRLPGKSTASDSDDEDVPPYFNFAESGKQFEWRQIEQYTTEDSDLNTVKDWILNKNWPSTAKDIRYSNESLKPYIKMKNELSLENGVITHGSRAVIPAVLRESVLKELHEAHMGIVKTKGLARMYVWWPGISKDIENMVGSCIICCEGRPDPQPAIENPWPKSTKPWQRIHLDYAGPFKGHMYMVVVDSYSKWTEVFIMPNITAETTILKLYETFSRFGLPELVVSDNGTSLKSAELNEFFERNGISHMYSPVYHPKSNGQAENSVKTFKASLEKMLKSVKGGNIHTIISRFLLNYRSTPHVKTKQPPAMLMLGRQPKIRLDLLKNIEVPRVSQTEDKIKKGRDMVFEKGSGVVVRDYRGNPAKPTWTRAVIEKRVGRHVYMVRVDGILWKRHLDQIYPFPQEPKDPVEGKHFFTSPDDVQQAGSTRQQARVSVYVPVAHRTRARNDAVRSDVEITSDGPENLEGTNVMNSN